MVRVLALHAPLHPVFCTLGGCFAKDSDNAYFISNNVKEVPNCPNYGVLFDGNSYVPVAVCNSQILVLDKDGTQVFSKNKDITTITYKGYKFAIPEANFVAVAHSSSSLTIADDGSVACVTNGDIAYLKEMIQNVKHISVTPDGKVMALSTQDERYHLFELSPGNVCRLNYLGSPAPRPHPNLIPFVYVSPANTKFVIFPISDTMLSIYTVQNKVNKEGTMKFDDGIPVAQAVPRTELVVTTKDGMIEGISRLILF